MGIPLAGGRFSGFLGALRGIVGEYLRRGSVAPLARHHDGGEIHPQGVLYVSCPHGAWRRAGWWTASRGQRPCGRNQRIGPRHAAERPGLRWRVRERGGAHGEGRRRGGQTGGESGPGIRPGRLGVRKDVRIPGGRIGSPAQCANHSTAGRRAAVGHPALCHTPQASMRYLSGEPHSR